MSFHFISFRFRWVYLFRNEMKCHGWFFDGLGGEVKGIAQLIERNKNGEAVGITSVCSAHPLVLEAALTLAKREGNVLLVEATSNQVDQFGGYTGMTPADFRERLYQLADRCGVEREMVILGGDHLGPNRWQGLSASEAMAHAETLIATYVAAGFKKIHLDCSMACSDDPLSLSDEVVAERAARLAVVANAHVGICLGEFSASSVTGLIAFELKTNHPDVSAQFVLNIPVTGLPEERNSAILQTVISNQEGFLRYLVLLLGDDKVSGLDIGCGSGFAKWLARLSDGEDIPLLEELTRTYSRHPERLSEISGLVRDLSQGRENAIIPKDFLNLWTIFESAIGERNA